MAIDRDKMQVLRKRITEGLRIQRDSGDAVPYIDVSNVLGDVSARQNHAIFARRGCGKTLLLHNSSKHVDANVRTVYLNCEDFKRHSFPNVLIEILDALFGELEVHLSGWFGKKRASRELIRGIRKDLQALRQSADTEQRSVRQLNRTENSTDRDASLSVKGASGGGSVGLSRSKKHSSETESNFVLHNDKLQELDSWLPRLKQQVREFFGTSKNVQSVFLQIDDLYHLKRSDQPFVMDYIHRLCKDVPLYFKVATLRHASSLYVDFENQPIGAQERHDYQPINIDYTFIDFKRTRDQNRAIFYEFGKAAGIKTAEIDGLFKGAGFDRLVMAGGGVPRDTLSLFLEVISVVTANGDQKVGKDDVRILSKSNFERRINELKEDADGSEQGILLRGIYALRTFCLNKKTNVFLVSEQLLQQEDDFRSLVHRLLDYRIIHSAASALTHKSQPGTYQAFAIDLGCYAHLRKLGGRFNELDVSANDFKERLRSAPIFGPTDHQEIVRGAPEDVEGSLLDDEAE